MAEPYDTFGIECGKGWSFLYNLVLDRADIEDVEVAQIKEKFGLLRIYLVGGNDGIQSLVDAVEVVSASVCEDCGKLGRTRTTPSGWIRTICDGCDYENGPR